MRQLYALVSKKGRENRGYVKYEDAMKSDERFEWQNAIEKEVNTLMQFNTFTFMLRKDIPKDAVPIGSSNLLNKKYDENGIEVKKKSRIVLRGDQQREDDYDEISSPVLEKKSFNILLAIANQFGLKIFQLDFMNAYLHANIDKEIYVEIPPGFPHYGDSNWVAKLNKALYGAKQAGKLFNDQVVKFMLEHGFRQCFEDPCLFHKITNSGHPMMCGVYVDDTITAVAPDDMTEYTKFIIDLKQKFTIEERGHAKWVLGVKIDYDIAKGVLKLTQQAYLEKILRRFGMDAGSRPMRTPAEKSIKYRNGLHEVQDTEFPYLEAVGALLYAAYATRPDILHAVNHAAQHASAPTNVDVAAVKRIYKYLRSTIDLGLVYSRCKSILDFQLKIYADAAFDVNEGSKSQTGYFIKLGHCNIYSQSRKQNIIAQSSCEAEYIAMTDSSNEAIGICYLLKELIGVNNFNPHMVIYTDSTAAMSYSNNQKQSKMKHINRRLNVIKDRIKNSELTVRYISTEEQVADMLTKALNKDRYVKLRSELMGYMNEK
jgi:ribonuclease HI